MTKGIIRLNISFFKNILLLFRLWIPVPLGADTACYLDERVHPIHLMFYFS